MMVYERRLMFVFRSVVMCAVNWLDDEIVIEAMKDGLIKVISKPQRAMLTDVGLIKEVGILKVLDVSKGVVWFR